MNTVDSFQSKFLSCPFPSLNVFSCKIWVSVPSSWTGHCKDEETMCAEYKVSAVEVQKISNQFKTEIKQKENQAEVN